jgi:hypothetical protein
MSNTTELDEAKEKLKTAIEAPMPSEPKISTKKQALFSKLKDIPFLVPLLTNMDDTGSVVSRLVELTGYTSKTISRIATGLQYAGLGVEFINFLRIPLFFLAAAILGEKPPFKLSKAAKWLYSGVLLGLCIMGMALPIVAPYLAVVTATLVLAVSVFTLGRFFYQRYQFKKTVEQLQEQIDSEQINLESIKSDANACLEDNTCSYGNSVFNINQLTEALDSKKESLQDLYNLRQVSQEKLQRRNAARVLDKGVGLVMASVVVVGTVTAIFFPVVGIGILAFSGIAGLSYVFGRSAISLTEIIARWLVKKMHAKGDGIAPESESAKNTLDSTVVAISKLGGAGNGIELTSPNQEGTTQPTVNCLFSKTQITPKNDQPSTPLSESLGQDGPQCLVTMPALLPNLGSWLN